MIATASKKIEKVELVSGLPDNIFAGLSFPAPPTSDVIVKPKAPQTPVVAKIDVSRFEEDDNVDESSKPLIAASATSSKVTTQSVVSTKTTLNPLEVKRHLSKLYASEVSVFIVLSFKL